MAGKRKLSPEIEALIRQEYEEGTRARTLAARYGVDDVTIVRTVRRAGGTLRCRGGDPARQQAIEDAILATDTRPHGAKHIPALDYRLTREERARRSLASYFSTEEGRR